MNFSSQIWRRIFAVAALLLIAGAPAVLAQEETGNLYGEVIDNSGEALPGVTITVTGIGAPKVVQTNAQGAFRILSLDPGFYQLVAELEGFSTVEYPNVNIRVSRSTTLDITLSPAVEEVITVTSESPLLDERKVSSGQTITQIELEKIPTARDPWSVLTQTPGVVSDRINVGGNESGQQAVFRGPGVSDDENTFMVDGVEITDMSAIGSSPTYYDFDQFTEMQFSTGGSDVSKSAAGVSVNLVTRRGTNEFRGSSRYMVTDQDFLFFRESSSDFSQGDLGDGQTEFVPNRIRRIEDFGFNAGGPVLRDKLWFWGSWGENDIKQTVGGGGSDDTILENAAFKVNAQLASNNTAQGSWNNGNKQKFGRGAGPDRSQETTFNQRGPTAIIKAEDTHIFSSNFFLTGQWSKVDGGFALRSQAGGFEPDLPETLWDSDGVWKNGFVSGSSKRPANEWKLDGSYFFNTGTSTNHELKFGGRFRNFESSSPFGWPGRNIVHIAGENFGNNPGPGDFFFLYRSGLAAVDMDYTSAWAQDTITFGNFTINAGLRYDLQEGKNPADTVQNFSGCDPNQLFGCLPAIDFPGNDGGGFDWTTISPRIGLTYALGEDRKTLLRASVARFPEQLSSANIAQVNPLGASYSYFYFIDQNDNNMWDGTEVDGDPFFLFPSGFDPANPSSVISPNQTDSGLDPSLTDEVILGVEHALLPEFVVGATFTWRQTNDVLESPSFVTDGVSTRLVTAGDYVPDGSFTGNLPNGQAFDEPRFALDPNLSFTGGDLQRNGDRSIDYQGFNVNFTKRLANRWMLRGYVSWENVEWGIGSKFTAFDRPSRAESGADIDGTTYAIQSGGSGNKGDVWLQSSWAFNVNGMYQVAPDRPWGFNIAANVFGREGYPLPYFADATLSDGTAPDTLIAPKFDSFRADDILTIDFRIDKDFNAGEDVSFTVSLDIFNALNEAYVLQRERDFTNSRYDFLDETLSPRIFRLGVRLNWR